MEGGKGQTCASPSGIPSMVGSEQTPGEGIGRITHPITEAEFNRERGIHVIRMLLAYLLGR